MNAPEKALIPSLRFPEFSGEWEEKRLGQLGDTISGLTYSPSDIRDHGLLVLRSSNVQRGQIDLNDCVFVDPEIRGANIAEAGDILICVRNGSTRLIGKSTVIPELFQLSTHGAFMTTFRSKNWKFISQLFKHRSYKKQVAADLGARINSINSGQLKRYKFLLPVNCEQQKIADYLGAVDAKLRLLKRRRDALTAYKKGIMQRIFAQEIRFTQDDSTAFPDWQEKQFGDVFRRVMRKNTENNTNVLTISAQQGLINQQEFFNKSVSASDVTGYYLLHKNDFAYNKSYSKGYPMGAVKRLKRYDKGVVSTLYICFATIEPKGTGFFEQYFDSGGLNRELHKIAQEGARNHGLLNLSVIEFFRDMLLPYPHPDEQQKIADFLSAIDDKITVAARQINAMQDFKKSMLQQMFV